MNPLIINPRSTTGGGKTYIVRQIMKKIGVMATISNGQGKLTGYYLNDGSYVMGSYEMTCGGADTVKTQAEICTLVNEYVYDFRNVIFEGVLASHIYGRYLELSRNLLIGIYVWCFIDTPLDVCIQRVIERRKAAGNNKPFDPEPHTIPKYKSILRATEKAINDKQLVVVLDHKKAVKQTIKILTKREFPKDRTYNLNLYEEALYG